MLRVDEPGTVAIRCEHVEHRPPGHARALDRDPLHVVALHPLAQRHQASGHGGKRAHPLLDLPLRLGQQHAGPTGLLVDR